MVEGPRFALTHFKIDNPKSCVFCGKDASFFTNKKSAEEAKPSQLCEECQEIVVIWKGWVFVPKELVVPVTEKPELFNPI